MFSISSNSDIPSIIRVSIFLDNSYLKNLRTSLYFNLLERVNHVAEECSGATREKLSENEIENRKNLILKIFLIKILRLSRKTENDRVK